MCTKKIALLFFLLCLFQSTFSQINNEDKAYYLAFDSIIGQENTSLYNGKRYVDRYRSLENKHRYFLQSKFQKGHVVYNQQPFFNINLKYDLFEDVLIAKLSGNKSFFNMVFISEHVEKFSIQEHQFINLNVFENSNFTGFAEIIYSGNDLILLKKWTKEKKDNIRGQAVVYEFDENLMYIVSNKGKLETIKSKNSLKKLIPEKSSIINEFYRDQKPLLKSNPDLFMKQLIIKINENVFNETQKNLE